MGKGKIYVFKEPVRMVVISPVFGSVEVSAYCVFDAKLQAAGIWGVGVDQLGRVQVGIEKSAVCE